MNTTVTVLNAAQLIAASPAPVVLLDTCTLLDVIRVPQRPEIQNAVVSEASHMKLKASANPKQLWIVTAQLVDTEWNDNYQTVETELAKHIKTMDRGIVDLGMAVNHLLPANPMTHQAFTELQLPMHLRKLAQSLLDSSVLIAEDDDCILRARYRLRRGEPPAQKGKQEYKDCEIIEHYLALCKELRNNRFQEKCVFTSSNTKDYCDGSKKLHLNLKTEFDAVGIEYARDIAHANSLVK